MTIGIVQGSQHNRDCVDLRCREELYVGDTPRWALGEDDAMKTQVEIARDIQRATNKQHWCDTHCERTVNEDWDTVVVHKEGCPCSS